MTTDLDMVCLRCFYRASVKLAASISAAYTYYTDLALSGAFVKQKSARAETHALIYLSRPRDLAIGLAIKRPTPLSHKR